MNLVRAQDLTDLLVTVRDEPWFDTWYDALPIAGNPDRFTGGTLRSRMRNTAAANNLHGKTGSLTGVTALSGYVTNADGRELVFSMISNNYLTSPAQPGGRARRDPGVVERVRRRDGPPAGRPGAATQHRLRPRRRGVLLGQGLLSLGGFRMRPRPPYP